MASLGRRIYVDDFGSPYVRLTTPSLDDPDFAFVVGDVTRGFTLYVPKFAPDPNYASWPAAFREIVPEEWSGDLTHGGWASAYRGDPNVYRPILEQVPPPSSAYVGAYDPGPGLLRQLYANLRVCGWGRWVGAVSNVTGQRGVCESKTSLDFSTLGRDIADHFRVVGGKMGMVLRGLAKIISFVPGVGTVVAAVLAGIGSLAAGEPLDAAFLDAVVNAIPGGGIVKDAAKTGVAMAKKLIAGGNVGDAALEGARTFLAQQGVPPEALQAFDIGVALGTGEGLQSAGFKVLNLFAPGDDFLQRGLNYVRAVEKSAATGKSLQDVLKSTLGSELRAIDGAAAQLGPVIEQIDKNPNLIEAGSYALAEQLGVPEPVARAGQVIMRDGIEDAALRRELTQTATEKAFDKYGGQAVASESFAPSWYTSVLNEKIERAALEDDALKWTAQKAAQDADLRRSAIADFRTSWTYQYYLETGIDLHAPPPAPVAVVASSAPKTSRSTTGQDVALGVTVVAALGALYWWSRA